MTTLYANPYNLDAAGFYFESADEFTEKAQNLTDRYSNCVEEFEIDFIDGDDASLFNACGFNQANLSAYFNDVEPLSETEKAALFFLLSDLGYSLADALDKVDEVSLYSGKLLDAASELFDECYLHDIPEQIRYYVDYEKFARDCEISRDMIEFEFNDTTYTCTNAAGV